MTEIDYTSTERRIFLHMISQASAKGWRLDETEARELVDLGLGLNLIEPEQATKLKRELQYGHVFLREDGKWACTTCGGNCGQCGMTDFYGNIGFSMDHLARTDQGRHSLPVYTLRKEGFASSYGELVWKLRVPLLLALALVLSALALSGCATTAPPPCTTCIGPYDVTLSSHREALGLED